MTHTFTRGAFALAICIAVGCSVENSLVGGRCVEGRVQSGNACVPANANGDASSDGAASTDEDAGTIDPNGDDAAASTDGSTNTDADAVDAGDGAIVSPPIDFPIDYPPIVLPLVCAAPLVECRGACISVSDDGANCGACGKTCASNICTAGLCQGATPGDVVVIGHDFAQTPVGSSQAKVLVNALTIPTTEPIRVLSYESGAESASVAQVETIANGIQGRTTQFTHASGVVDLASPTLELSYDVVIIHDASGVDPVATGLGWKVPLATFTSKGGVVIALDRGTSAMPQLLTSAGLLAVGGHTQLPANSHLVVSAAGDVVGSQVLSPYAAFGKPVSFQGAPAESGDLTWVVRRQVGVGVGDPVVVHRVVR